MTQTWPFHTPQEMNAGRLFLVAVFKLDVRGVSDSGAFVMFVSKVSVCVVVLQSVCDAASLYCDIAVHP